MKKLISLTLLGTMASSLLTGCHTDPKITVLSPTDASTKNLDFSFDEIETQYYIDNYQKQQLTKALNEVTTHIKKVLP